VPYKYLFELPFLNRAAFVHSVGDVFAIQQYGVRVPIVLAPNGFDIRSIPPGLTSDAIVRRWPSAAGRRVALFVGRLDVEQKGLDLLLHGFQQATNREEWVLVLVGPDWSGGLKTLNRMATQLGIDHEVCFWGPAFGREKFELLASADAFVCASRWEGFPFSVIEALASGLPCVVTAAADPMGLVARSGAGRTVDPGRREVAAAISELGRVGSADLRKMGEKGRELVARELSWDAIARTIEEAYARYCAV
jgi:glycosyltransferase involved in cell wall biosynthesis